MYSVNPLWPHYGACAILVFALLVGLLRSLFIDPLDPIHCDALMNKGSWLDAGHKDWQPEGCMLHKYRSEDASMCLASEDIVFIGDSVTRKLFFQFAHILDPKLPTAPSNDDYKHSDHNLLSSARTQLFFYWDPFLNSSHVRKFIGLQGQRNPNEEFPVRDPFLLVLGSGLWYLRYSNSSGGLAAWEANVEAILNAITFANPLSTEVVFLPIEEVVPSKLSPERANTMQSADIDAMNSDLYHRIHPPSQYNWNPYPGPRRSMPVSLPLVFNKMLDASQTDDGLHYHDALIQAQANLLLNLRCNDALPKHFPMDKTCCRHYPWPHMLQLIILGVTILWGPYMWFLSHRTKPGGSDYPLIHEDQIPALVFSASVALVYIADRTGFWLKEQKYFSPWTFSFLCFASLVIGIGTVKKADRDLGFLNREQTDEWKGWMQIVILVYHYLGASKVSGIYNPIRVLVAAYLFMTGYGHTTFYLKKADFSFQRVAQVMIRLNMLTILLAYVMNTDYISYYFAPLVSLWFLIIYGTMSIGSKLNDRIVFFICKILVSMATVTWFMREPWLLEMVFEFLERICGIHWSAPEWAFRVHLDLWIVYFGMFAALMNTKLQEHRFTDHPQWPLVVRVSVLASGFVILWFFAFELLQESKFTYNVWHPYISFLPIVAFVILRNANTVLRSASSQAFSFIGRCSLETFIIQYHFWLAGDTKGVLLVLPMTQHRPLNFVITTIMFIYMSYHVSQATAVLTTWICGGTPPTLPTVAQLYSGRRDNSAVESITLLQTQGEDDHLSKDEDRSPVLSTPLHPQQWIDRLTERPSTQSSAGFRVWYGETEWKPGVKTKLALCAGVMWIINLMWTYP